VENVKNFKNVAKETKKAIARARRRHIVEAFSNVTNSGEFYKAHQRLFKQPKETVPTLCTAVGLITDATEKATAINEQCATKWPAVSPDYRPMQFDSTIRVPADCLCTPTWTLEQLLKLKVKKATGADDVPPLFLNMMAEILCRPLTIIFNRSLTEGSLPTIWRHAIVVPIPKVPNPTSADEFRPLAITCTASKLMERHIKTLIEHAAPDAVPPFQYAFEAGVGTTDAIQHVMHGIGKSMEFCKSDKTIASTATNVSMVALDIARAFDSLPHSVVIDTMSKLDMPLFLIRWIQAFLTNRTQQVRVNDKLSPSIAVTASVVQGSTLGPTLFKYVVAALGNVDLAATTHLVMFADDAAMIGPTQDDARSRSHFYNVTLIEWWTASRDWDSRSMPRNPNIFSSASVRRVRGTRSRSSSTASPSRKLSPSSILGSILMVDCP
jgi:hypothetical protein